MWSCKHDTYLLIPKNYHVHSIQQPCQQKRVVNLQSLSSTQQYIESEKRGKKFLDKDHQSLNELINRFTFARSRSLAEEV